MPAIITHDFFGQDLLEAHPEYAGAVDERQAFMLGCQGPDPLFYTVVDPRLGAWKPLGTIFHKEQPSAMLYAFRGAVDNLPEKDQSIGLAYARGLLAHYALDSQVHPLVYAQEYALCDAGVSDLTRSDGRYVHAVIEAELDEVVLFGRRHETIRMWKPYEQILQASDEVLSIVSRMYAAVAKQAYHLEPPVNLFAQAVKCFRLVQRAVYSPGGKRRNAIAFGERLVNKHSLAGAISHRAVAAYACPYDNHEFATWTNPFTGRKSTLDFWSLCQQAQSNAVAAIRAFEEPGFSLDDARRITGGLNFMGDKAE